MIPQIISKIATFRPFNLSTDEIVAAIQTSFACPTNMILDILTFQNNFTDSEIIAVVGVRYAEQIPIRNEAKQAKQEELKKLRNEAKQAKQEELKKLRNEAKQAKQEERKQVLADAKLAIQLAAGIASVGGSSPSSYSVVSPPPSKVIAKTATSMPSPTASSASSGASVSASVPIVTAAKVKAKPSVVLDWIEIEDEQFMIDKNGNVFDPENNKKIGKYDKMQKKWISGGIPTLEEATEVKECIYELLVAASASSTSSSSTSSTMLSEAVSSASAANTKAKPAQKKSVVEYDWITIEGELFTIDNHGNVFDNDKKIGTYDKMQKKLLSDIASSDDEATEVEECTIDGKTYLKDDEGVIYDFETEDPVGKYNFKLKKWINPPTAASASSSSMAAKYDAVRPSEAQRVRSDKKCKLSKSGASRIACHIASEAALTEKVLVGGIDYTYNFHSIFDKNGTCIVKFQSPDCNLSYERLKEKVKKAIYTKTHSEKKKIQLQILRQQAVRLADVKEIVNQ